MKEIMKQVKSPFSDEFIKKIIFLLLDNDMDARKMYATINHFDEEQSTQQMDEFDSKYIFRDCDKYLSRNNEYWTIIRSKSPFKYPDNDESYLNKEKNHLRIYLNIPKEYREIFIMRYMIRCEEEGVPLNFKFAHHEGRLDNFVSVCPIDDEEIIKKELAIIEEITKDIPLGELPPLVGMYKGKIGICEGDRTNSYTEDIISFLQHDLSLNMCRNEEFGNRLKSLGLYDKEMKPRMAEILFPDDPEEFEMIAQGLFPGSSKTDSKVYQIFKDMLVESPRLLKQVINDFYYFANGKDQDPNEYKIRGNSIVFLESTEREFCLNNEKKTGNDEVDI